MKPKIAIVLGATLGAAGAAANAAFVGLDFENYVGPGWVENGFSGLFAWRIYAEFNDPTDSLVAVFGIPGHPLIIHSWSGLFFNSAWANSLTAPMPLMPVIWSNQWDTYVTIGTDSAVGDTTSLTPYFNGEVGGLAGNFTTTNGAWFVLPGDPQGQAGTDGRVLIAQLVTSSYESFQGVFNLQFEGGVQALDEYLLWPAPGGLALFALGALAGARRRR